MFKHIKPKDILEFILLGVAVIVLLVVGGMENQPLPVLLPTLGWIAVILWVTWFIVIARERKQRAENRKLHLFRNGEWQEVDPVSPALPTRRQAQFYDQDEDAIKHLDPDTAKENQA